MSKEFSRKRRVGEQIQRELAQLIPQAITVEKSGLITVSSVEISPDFKQSKVYITVIGGSMERKAVLDLLEEHAVSLRYELAHSLNLRSTPKLNFIYDESVERGAYLSGLINKANDK